MADTSQLPLRGTKRKAGEINEGDCKRVRSSHSPAASESSITSSVISSTVQVSTPSTPASTLPSRQKRLHCTWPGCSKAFSRPVHLSSHLDTHRGIRNFACTHCTKAFFRKSHLAHHVKSAHTAVRDHLCPEPSCGKAFATGTRLRRHAAAHTARERFRCARAGCEHSFRKHATLQRHVATAHDGQAAFVCDRKTGKDATTLCGAGFATGGKLRAHQGRVHGEARFWCTLCRDDDEDEDGKAPASFSTYAAFKAHNAAAHPPACTLCDFAGRSSRELRRHGEMVHGILPAAPRTTWACDRPGCTKSFSKPANLKMHVRSAHDGQRFVCGEVPPSQLNHAPGWTGTDACGRSFAAKSSLETHVRVAHLGLPNLRKKGSVASPVPAPAAGPTSIALVSGTTYADTPRPLPCLVQGCNFRFHRAYDRAVHARARHGMDPTEMAALAAAAGAGSVTTTREAGMAAKSASNGNPDDDDVNAEGSEDEWLEDEEIEKDDDDDTNGDYEAGDNGCGFDSLIDTRDVCSPLGSPRRWEDGLWWMGGPATGTDDADEAEAWEMEDMWRVLHPEDDDDAMAGERTLDV